jgi:hypothetical protein
MSVSLDDKAQMENLVVDLTRELGEREGPVKIRDEEMRVYGSFSRPGSASTCPCLPVGSFGKSY